jgi:hypothetical protein
MRTSPRTGRHLEVFAVGRGEEVEMNVISEMSGSAVISAAAGRQTWVASTVVGTAADDSSPERHFMASAARYARPR